MFGKLLVVLQNLVSTATIAPDMRNADIFGFGWFGNCLGSFFTFLWNGICWVFYWICKWLLAFVDFLQYFIQKLIGLDYWLSNNVYTIEGATSNDLLFGFLFNDTVQRVFRAMLAIFFVLLIIFTIFAIVRQEWTYITGNNFGDGKGNSKGQILRGSIKAIALVLVFPIVLSAGIIASNAILASLVKALNIDMGSTFGNTLFYVSSLNANKYRAYANDGYRHAVSDEVNFYIIQPIDSEATEKARNQYASLDLEKDAGKVLLLGTASFSDNYSRMASGYEEYLKIIQFCKRYTVNAIFDPLFQKNGADIFTGYCIGMRLGDSSTRTYFMVKANPTGTNDINTPEAWYYYLRNVLQVDIMSASNNIGSSSIHSDVRGNFAPIAGERCLISKKNIGSLDKGPLATACTNTWSYPSVYTHQVAFNLGASSAVIRSSYDQWDDTYAKKQGENFNSLLGNIMGYESGSVKLAYNSNEISSYFDGGQRGVVQMKSEYNVMADVMDFTLKNGLKLYILDATSSLLDWNFRNAYNTDYNVASNLTSDYFSLPCASNEGGIKNEGLYYKPVKPFIVSYSEDCEEEFGNYLYLANSYGREINGGYYNREIDGKVYIMCLKENDNQFIPLINGKTYRLSDGSSYNFKSSYYASDYKGVVIAKGAFYSDIESTDTRVGEPTYLQSGHNSTSESQAANSMYYYELKKDGNLSQYAEIDSISQKNWVIGDANVLNTSSSTQYTTTVLSEEEARGTKYENKLAYRIVDENGGLSVNESVISSLTFNVYMFALQTRSEISEDEIVGGTLGSGGEIILPSNIKYENGRYYKYDSTTLSPNDWGQGLLDEVKDNPDKSIVVTTNQAKCYVDNNSRITYNADGCVYYLFTINEQYYMIVEVNQGEGIVAPLSMTIKDDLTETYIEADRDYISLFETDFENGSEDTEGNKVKIKAGSINSCYMNYNVYYDYNYQNTYITSNPNRGGEYVYLNESEKVTTSSGLNIAGNEYSKYLYRTSALTVSKDYKKDESGNPVKDNNGNNIGLNSETTRFSVLFEEALISMTGVVEVDETDSSKDKLLSVGIRFGTPTNPIWADAISNKNTNVHESIFFTIYLYNYMTGAVGDGSSGYTLKEYSYTNSSFSDVIRPDKNNENEKDRVLSFKINSDFTWDRNSSFIGLYDGKTYVATIYKPIGQEINFNNISSATTSILYDYATYSNILTQNCYKEQDDLKAHYNTVRSNLTTACMRRGAGFYKFAHADGNWSFLFDIRLNIMLTPLTMETINAKQFNITQGISFDYFFDGVYDLTDFYVSFKLNFIILIVGSALIIKVLGTALWGVIKRFYEITLYFLATPAVASTIPLDNGARFTRSIQQPLISKVLSTYGVILGINVFFILLMPIESLSHVFTAEDIATSGSYFLKHLGFGLLPDSVKATMLNMYVYILFLLVAFTMIEALPKTITQLLGVQGAGGDVLDSGNQTKGEAAKAVKSSMDMATGKSAMDTIKRGAGAVKESAVGGLVGSAIGAGKKAVEWGKNKSKVKDDDAQPDGDTPEGGGSGGSTSRAADGGEEGSEGASATGEGATAENATTQSSGEGGTPADVEAPSTAQSDEATASEAFNQQLFEGIGQPATEGSEGAQGEQGNNAAQQLINKDDIMQMILNAVKNLAPNNLAMQALTKVKDKDENGNEITRDATDEEIKANLEANPAAMQAVQSELGKNLALGLNSDGEGPQNATEGLILDQAQQSDDLKAKAILARMQSTTNPEEMAAISQFATATGLSTKYTSGKDENGNPVPITRQFEDEGMALEAIKAMMNKGGNPAIEAMMSGEGFDAALMGVAKDEAQKGNFTVSAWDLQKSVDGAAAESFKEHAVLAKQTGDPNARTADERAIEDQMSLELMQQNKGEVLIDAMINDKNGSIVDNKMKTSLVNNAVSTVASNLGVDFNDENSVNEAFEELGLSPEQLLEFEKAELTSKEDILLATSKAALLGVDTADTKAVVESLNASDANDKILEALKDDENAVNSIIDGLGDDTQNALMESMLSKDGVSYVEQQRLNAIDPAERQRLEDERDTNLERINDVYNKKKAEIEASGPNTDAMFNLLKQNIGTTDPAQQAAVKDLTNAMIDGMMGSDKKLNGEALEEAKKNGINGEDFRQLGYSNEDTLRAIYLAKKSGQTVDKNTVLSMLKSSPKDTLDMMMLHGGDVLEEGKKNLANSKAGQNFERARKNKEIARLDEQKQESEQEALNKYNNGINELESGTKNALSEELREKAIQAKRVNDTYDSQAAFMTADTVANGIESAIKGGTASAEVVSAISNNIAAGYNLTDEKDETAAREAAAAAIGITRKENESDEDFDSRLSTALKDDANKMKFDQTYDARMDEANKIKFLAGYGKIQDAQLELIKGDRGMMKDAEKLYRDQHQGEELKYLSEAEQNAFLLQNFGESVKKKAADKVNADQQEIEINKEVASSFMVKDASGNPTGQFNENVYSAYAKQYRFNHNVKDFGDLNEQELTHFADLDAKLRAARSIGVDIEHGETEEQFEQKLAEALKDKEKLQQFNKNYVKVDTTDSNQLKALKSNYDAHQQNLAILEFESSLSADEQNEFIANSVGESKKNKLIKSANKVNDGEFDTSFIELRKNRILNDLNNGANLDQMIVQAGVKTGQVKAAINGLAADTENGGAEIVAQAKKDIIANSLQEGQTFDTPRDVSKMSVEEQKAYNFNLNMLQQQTRQEDNHILQNIFNNSNILNKKEIQDELDRIAKELANQAKKDGTDKYADPKNYIDQAFNLYMNKHTDTKDQLLSIGASDVTMAITQEDLLMKQKMAIANNSALRKTIEDKGLDINLLNASDIKTISELDKSFASLLNKQVTKAVAPSANMTQEQQDAFFASQTIDGAKKKKKKKPANLSEALAEYREEEEKDPKFKRNSVIFKPGLKKKLPKDAAQYDNWNMLIEKQIQAAKAGKGTYATMSAEQRNAEIEKLKAKKIYKGDKKPEAYFKMSAEEQANFDREQDKLKYEALQTKNYNRVYKKSVKVEKPKTAHKQFVKENGSSFRYVKPNSRKSKHERNLATIKGRIDTYNSMRGMRNDSVEFGARFDQFASAYLNEKQINKIKKDAAEAAQKGTFKDKNGRAITDEAKIRKAMFERNLGIQYKVASKKVARDNGANKVSFLEQKNVGGYVVRYKDAQIRRAAGAGFWHPINRGRWNAREKAERGEVLTNREKKRAAKSNSEVYQMRVRNEQATARANLDKFAGLLKKGGLNKDNFKDEATKMFGPAVEKLFNKKGVGGNLGSKALAIQQREVQKLLERLAGQAEKKVKTIGKNTTLVSTSKDVAAEFIGKNYGRAKTQTEVKLDKMRAEQLSAALNKVANSKGLTFEQVKRLIPPELLTEKIKLDGKKVSRTFKETGKTDAEKIANLQSFLQAAAARANKKVAMDNMFKSDKDKLMKLNGVMVNKNEVFKKGDISPNMIRAMGAANRKLYGNIMQNYNQNQARLAAEEATRKTIVTAYQRLRNMPLTGKTRKQMEALSERMKDSDKRLNILKAELKRSESRKKQFEARYATTQKVQAKTSGSTQKVAVNSQTRATDKYRFYQKASDGSKQEVKDSLTQREVNKIANDAMKSIKSSLESMVKSLNDRTYSELRSYINRTRSSLSNDFGANINAMKNVLETLRRKVKQDEEAAKKTGKKTDDKISLNERKLKKTEEEIKEKLKALGIELDSIELK